MQNPVPFQVWAKQSDEPYPTLGVLYNWTRPGPVRDEMVSAGVIVRVNGRWLFNPSAWREYCTNQFRHRRVRGEAATA